MAFFFFFKTFIVYLLTRVIMYIVIIKSRCICVYHAQLFILEIQNCHDLQQLRYYVILDFHSISTIMIHIITEWYTRINLSRSKLVFQTISSALIPLTLRNIIIVKNAKKSTYINISIFPQFRYIFTSF